MTACAIADDRKHVRSKLEEDREQIYDHSQMPRQDQLTRIAHCCAAAVPGVGGAFFNMPLGLEVDALRVGTTLGVGTDDIRFV